MRKFIIDIMKILIPPSEGKTTVDESTKTFKETNSKFSEAISKILETLNHMEPNQLGKIYGTSSEKSLALHQINLNIFDSLCSEAIKRVWDLEMRFFVFSRMRIASLQ